MKLLTVQETATILGRSPGLVYSLCARKRLRHERHGLGRGKIRIPEDASSAGGNRVPSRKR